MRGVVIDEGGCRVVVDWEGVLEDLRERRASSSTRKFITCSRSEDDSEVAVRGFGFKLVISVVEGDFSDNSKGVGGMSMS